MNCHNCGTPIPVDERFCRNCGQEVVSLAPTIYAGVPQQPAAGSRPTEQFDPMKTESLNAQSQTQRDWIPPVMHSASASPTVEDRRSFLVPITVASIVIALVSIGALVYIIMSKDNGGQIASRPTENPQPSATPSVSSTSATPSPTAQASPSPTPISTPSPKPTPNTGGPPGARLGYCNDTNVFVRSSPNLNATRVTKISRGQKLWVMSTSSNYSTWNGITSNWTEVQIYNGSTRGWVFSPFVSY